MAVLVNSLRHPVTLTAADGSTLLIPTGKHTVNDKFAWNLPNGVANKSKAEAPSPASPTEHADDDNQ